MKLTGNYRPGKHGNRPEVGGAPARPADLSGDAAAWWDAVIPELVASGVAKRLDTSIAEQAARLWGLLCEAHRQAERDPVDKDTRIAVTAYYAAWERAATKLGLSPVDRARIVVQEQQRAGIATRQRGAS